MVTINVKSGRIGSNPGGKCSVPYANGDSIDAYLKYIQTSKLPRTHPFKPENQPVYEAVTLALADCLGLEIPEYRIFDNEKRDIQFNHDNSIPPNKRLDESKRYYLISKLVALPKPEEEDAETLTNKMADEKFYRDLLMVGDVSGRKQNYALVSGDGEPYVLYIDLGCSFVDASEGQLSQRREVSSLLYERNGRGPVKKDLRKELRRAEKKLKEYAIMTNHRREQDKDLVNVLECIEGIPNLEILIYPYGKRKIKNLLSDSEITEILNLLKLNMETTIREYLKKKPESVSDKIIKL